MTSTYRYLTFDLRTNLMLGEILPTGVSYGWVLKGVGSFQGSIMLGQNAASSTSTKISTDAFVIAATEKGRTALFVERDGVLLWGGIIWTRHYKASTRMLDLAGLEFWSYWRDHRLITDPQIFAGADQLAIAQALLTYAASKTGGDIGLTIPTPTSGVLRDRTYNGYELKLLGQAVEELAAVDNGFDFAVDVAWSGTPPVPTKTLTLSYPRRGRIEGSTGHVFEWGKNIIDYDFDEDATLQAVAVTVAGAGSGDLMLRSTNVRTDVIDAGYPLSERSIARKDDSVQATIDAAAKAAANASAQAVTALRLLVKADVDPVLGAWIVGDDARVIIADERFPNTLDQFRRIIAATVHPGDLGEETVDIVTGDLLG